MNDIGNKKTNHRFSKLLGLLKLLLAITFIIIIMNVYYLAQETLTREPFFLFKIFFAIGLIILYFYSMQDPEFQIKRERLIAYGVFSLFLYWFAEDINARECFVLTGLLICVLGEGNHDLNNKYNYISKSISNIKHYLSSQDDIYYQLDVVITPNWGAILKKIFKDEKVIRKLINKENKLFQEEKNDSDRSLFERFLSTRFTEFGNNKIPASSMIYSNFHQCFMNGMSISGYLFRKGGALEEKFCILYKRVTSFTRIMFQPIFSITPSEISFRKTIDEIYILSKIPFYEIKELLFDIAQNIHPAYTMKVIRKFPTHLQEKLDKLNVKYLDNLSFDEEKDDGKDLKIYNEKSKNWAKKEGIILSSNTTSAHAFETECFTVYISIQCDTDNNRFDEDNY